VNLGRKINEVDHTSNVSAPEFIFSTVPQYCPAEYSDEDSDFICSPTMELFILNIEDELIKGAMMKNSKFAKSVPSAPSLSSIDAVMEVSWKDCTTTSSETGSVSSVECAASVVLSDFDDVSNTRSTSVWAVKAESTCLSKQDRTVHR